MEVGEKNLGNMGDNKCIWNWSEECEEGRRGREIEGGGVCKWRCREVGGAVAEEDMVQRSPGRKIAGSERVAGTP